MAASIQPLANDVDYYRDYLIRWYEEEYGYHIENYTNTNLRIIASFYGHEKLQRKYGLEMEEMWGAVDISHEAELDEVDLTDIQWGYGEPAASTCPDIWDLLDFDKHLQINQRRGKTY